jgi:arabinan endo-1,5-alpha-L-arabinosidase
MYGRVFDWHTLEGPTVVHRVDGYHLFFSGGSWEGDGYGVSVATATSPLGPWQHTPTDRPDVLSTAITGLRGPGHNSVVRDGDGFDLIAYHAWNAEGSRRQMYLDGLEWRVSAVPLVVPSSR